MNPNREVNSQPLSPRAKAITTIRPRYRNSAQTRQRQNSAVVVLSLVATTKSKRKKTMKLVSWMWFYQPMPMGAVNGHLPIGAGRKCLTVVIRAQVWLTPIIYMTLLATCAWCFHLPHRLYLLPATARMTHGQT